LYVVGYKHFFAVHLYHLSSAFFYGLCFGFFILFKRWKNILKFFLGGKGESSFAIFSLSVSL